MAETADLLQRGYRYALALTMNPVDAEDLLQDGWSSVLAARRAPTAPYQAEQLVYLGQVAKLVVTRAL
jgi:DNA-directed RNA polymerase specialized sigma24 family protein